MKRLASVLTTEETPEEQREENKKAENKTTVKSKIKTRPKINMSQSTSQETIENKTKKPREDYLNDTKLSIQELMAPLEDEIKNNPDKYILSFESISDFIEEAQFSKDKLITALEYTENIPKLLETLQNIHQNTQQRSLKIRTTKIINSINEQLSDEEVNTEENI